MVNQPTVNHGLAVRVLEDRRTKDFGGMQRRRCGQANADSIKVIDNSAILGNVVRLITEAELGVAHFLIEVVASVTFVDDDAVIPINRYGLSRFVGVQNPFDHTLYSGDVQTRVGIGLQIA